MAERYRNMENFFGALLLIGALFAFGLFNFKSDAPLVEAGLTAQAEAVVAKSKHGMKVMVDGRDITVTGLADDLEERKSILGAVRAIDGRGKLRSDISLLTPAEPYALGAVLAGDAPLRFTGAVPSEAVRTRWQKEFGDGPEALTLASGAPDEGWDAAVRIGLRALMRLEDGQLAVEERRLLLTGTALTPSDAEEIEPMLADLPEGYDLSREIEVLDDGSPLHLTALRRDGGMVQLSGKLPQELAQSLSAEGAEFERSPLPLPVPGWEGALLAGLDALNHLRSGQFALIGPTLSLTGEAWSQSAYDASLAALDGLPAGIEAKVAVVLADSGAPFELAIVKDGARATAAGKVPRSLAPRVLEALLDMPVSAEALEVARVSPGETWWEVASLGVGALRLMQDGGMELTDDGLRLHGLIAGPPEMADLEAHLAAMPEGVSLNVDVELIDDGTPLRLLLSRDATQAVASGKLPEALTPGLLAGSLGQDVALGDVLHTPKVAPSNWIATAQVGARALAVLEEGTLSLQGDALHLSGTLRTPAAERRVSAALGAMPTGYTATTDLTFRDDGRPFAFELVLDGQGAVLSGKVPRDLGPRSQSAILGRPVETEALDFAGVPADPEWWGAARAGIKALARLERGKLIMDAHQLTLRGTASDMAAVENAQTTLAPFRQAFKVTVEIVTP